MARSLVTHGGFFAPDVQCTAINQPWVLDSTAPKPIYIVDSGVIIKMVLDEENTASPAGEALTKLSGLVVGHLDEQSLLRRGLGQIGETTLLSWQVSAADSWAIVSMAMGKGVHERQAGWEG